MTDTPDLTPAELLQAAKETWKPSPHPFLPWLSDDELVHLLSEPDGPRKIADAFKEREFLIWRSLDQEQVDELGRPQDPYRYGFDLPHWRDADELICKMCDLLYIAGGKRAGKSEWAAKRVVQAAMKYARGVIWCFQDNHPTSIATQQKLVWKYLPPEIRAMNGKHDRRRISAVNYTQKNGFADGVLVLPNRTAIHFLTYNSEVTDYTGWQIGADVLPRDLDPNIPNIGAWADENMPLQWFENITFRATTRSAKVIWTFSTTEGITTTIKEVLGTPKTLKTRFAELLADRVNIPGLPVGHMPYVQQCSRRKTMAIYFHSELNLFGDNYTNVKTLCAGKPSAYVEENAYGFARDVMAKAFPLFGEWNIVQPENVPKSGTNYMLTDPGDGSRNWATIWVRVVRGGDHYIYRDWPDCQTYGEWAVPSADTKQPDGDRGPAQRSMGYGTEQLATEWRKLESSTSTGTNGEPQKEEIFQRFIDPRAGNTKHIEEHGGTCLIEKFVELKDPLIFTAASGVEKSIGFTHVNTMLWWNKEQPLCPIVNAPRLYVAANCHQVIWTMSNYTDRGGEKGGCKDFADLLRYMALADLQHYENTTFTGTSPGKGY